MNKMKEFLKAIDRKNAPSLDEIAGDDKLFNTYMAVFGPSPSEGNRRSLARETLMGKLQRHNERKMRERGLKH